MVTKSKSSPQVKRVLPNPNSSITMHNYTPVATYTESKAKRLASKLRQDGYSANAERISKNVWIVKRN